MENSREKLNWDKRGELFVLVLFVLAIYLPSVFYRLTYFDDYTLIVQSAKTLDGLQGIVRVFSSDIFNAETVAYRPVLLLSLMADAALAGKSPWIFHLTNLIIHLAASLFIYLSLHELEVGRRLAWLLSLFFAVHPALVPAVAWIPGRNDSLLGLFLAVGLLSLIKFLKGHSWAWGMIHICSLGAAFFTKESALVLPLALWPIVGGLKKAGRGRQIRLVAGWMGGAFLWLCLWYGAVGSNPESGAMALNHWSENFQGILGYLGKLIIPLGLSAIPAPAPWMIATGLSTLGLTSGAVSKWGMENPRIFMAGCLMVGLSLAPHLLRGAPFANFLEHRLYVPLIGFIIALSQLRFWLYTRWDKAASLGISLAAIGLYALAAILRLPTYQDHHSLWHNVIEKRPSIGLSYRNLGFVFTEAGEYGKAEIYYRRANRLNPGNREAYLGLGVALESQGRWEEAEQAFRQGLAKNPRSASLRYNLAWLYQSRGRLDLAEREYLLAISSRPGHLPSILNLGMLYHQQGRMEKAGLTYRRALDIDPNLPEALFNLGLLYSQQGWEDSAGYYVGRAFKLKPELQRAKVR